MKNIKRTLLTANTKFKFNCHSSISKRCFTKCCKCGSIRLNPFDILPMKKRLGISSEEFLENYTYYHIKEETSQIFPILKVPCPFLEAERCGLYAERPLECRLFPVGALYFKKISGEEVAYDIAYLLNEEPHCIGLKEDLEWTIERWRTDQRIDVFDDLYREWNEILLKANISGEFDQAQMYIAGHDVDRFRRFIFNSRFLDIVSVEEEEIEKIRSDDTALMKFGFKYLKHIFHIEETLKFKVNNQLKFEQIKREIMQI